MLILHETPGDFAKLSPTEIQAIIERYGAWTMKVAAAGKLVGGHKLMENGGKVVAKAGDQLKLVDGPYSEAKEVVGGYFILRADDYDDVHQWIEGHPHLDFGRIEVREVDFMGQPES